MGSGGTGRSDRPGGSAAAAVRSRSTGRSAARVATHAAPATTSVANSALTTASPLARRISAVPPTRSADATASRGVPSGANARSATHRRGAESRWVVTPSPAASRETCAGSSGNGGPASTPRPAVSTTRTPGTSVSPLSIRAAACSACARNSWSVESTSAPNASAVASRLSASSETRATAPTVNVIRTRSVRRDHQLRAARRIFTRTRPGSRARGRCARRRPHPRRRACAAGNRRRPRRRCGSPPARRPTPTAAARPS